MTQNSCQALELMRQSGYFDMEPCEKALDLEDAAKFTRLDIVPAQQMQISALMQSVPLAAAAGTLSNTYSVTFPEGLPHTLTKLKQGGWGSMLRGADGKIAGSASFYQMSAQAAMLGAFTAMSVATGQYFMAQIHRELKMISLKMDKILEFLYGEKKAEPEKTWRSGTDTFLRNICQDDRHLNSQKSIICLKRAFRESYGKEIPSEGVKE